MKTLKARGRSSIKTLFASVFLLVTLTGFCEQAGAQTVICTGSETLSFNPALTNTQRNLVVTDTASLSPCLVVGVSGINSATESAQGVANLSCQMLLGGGPATKIIHWSNGQSSTFSYTASSSAINGNFVITQTGNISAGLFKGQSAVGVSTLTSLSQPDFLTACAGSGVTSVSGGTTLTIAPPL
ncbi:hypothetical protein [Burkholderia ubonensis]|uniref:hypothetical protein n=1 Tax=Burkholderia ubonensis TaxID=101571 RepID=UPI000B14DC1C|nr:hypothetical protein [Burkholderia ubonensis]